MTNHVILTIEGLSSARIDALLLSRKLWKVRDQLEQCADSSNKEDPINRDIRSLFEDADHIVKLLENMDDRLLYLQQNQRRHILRDESHECV